MPGRTIVDAISDAITRGAITEDRAPTWVALDATRGDAVGLLDSLQGSQVLAAARREARSFATVGDGPYAAAAGTDPMYAPNPLLAEAQRDRPALVAIARAENPDPPRLFDDADLPRFTASGLPPSLLAGLPWPLRRAVAAAPTQAQAYRLVEKYQGNPENALTDLATARENVDYVAAFSQWLGGTGDTQVEPPGGRGAYTTEQLHQELFGDTTFVPMRGAGIPVQGK